MCSGVVNVLLNLFMIMRRLTVLKDMVFMLVFIRCLLCLKVVGGVKVNLSLILMVMVNILFGVVLVLRIILVAFGVLLNLMNMVVRMSVFLLVYILVLCLICRILLDVKVFIGISLFLRFVVHIAGILLI